MPQQLLNRRVQHPTHGAGVIISLGTGREEGLVHVQWKQEITNRSSCLVESSWCELETLKLGRLAKKPIDPVDANSTTLDDMDPEELTEEEYRILRKRARAAL